MDDEGSDGDISLGVADGTNRGREVGDESWRVLGGTNLGPAWLDAGCLRGEPSFSTSVSSSARKLARRFALCNSVKGQAAPPPIPVSSTVSLRERGLRPKDRTLVPSFGSSMVPLLRTLLAADAAAAEAGLVSASAVEVLSGGEYAVDSIRPVAVVVLNPGAVENGPRGRRRW